MVMLRRWTVIESMIVKRGGQVNGGRMVMLWRWPG